MKLLANSSLVRAISYVVKPLADRSFLNRLSWNVAGQAIPLVVAAAAMPVLVRTLGVPRFGVLSIVLILIGYFSILDLGVGRALTHRVAGRLAAGKRAAIGRSIFTGTAMMAVLGAFSGLALHLLGGTLVSSVLNVPRDLQAETLASVPLISLGLPLVIISTALRGVLEGAERFDLVNKIRLPTGILTFLLPLAVLPFAPTIVGVTGAIVAVRVSTAVAYATAVWFLFPGPLRRGRVSLVEARQLLGFGAWITLSNVISPILVNVDRLVIAARMPIAMLAYYSAPFDVIVRILFLPGAITSVLFPALTAQIAHEPHRAMKTFHAALAVITIAMGVICATIALGARPALELWLGAEFAEHGTLAAQIFTAGVFFNSVALVPFALVQAAGRPDLTAKLHAAELLTYLPVLLWLVDRYGIEGAAIAWAFRMGLDMLGLLAIAIYLLGRRTSAR